MWGVRWGRWRSDPLTPPPARTSAPRRPRGALLAAVAVVVAVACWAAAVTVDVLRARETLVAARSDLEEGRALVLEGRLEQAAAAFGRGRDGFADAEARLARLHVRPLAAGGPGNNLRVVRGLARAGVSVATAAADATGALAQLPGGLAALRPRDGAVPLAQLERLAPVVGAADARVEAAAADVEALPRTWLAEPVAAALQEFETVVAGPAAALDTGAALLATMPDFLGGSGPRRYLVAASNPAELRGTGGFLGAYALVTFDQGRLRLDDFAPIQDLPNVPPADIAAPDPSFAARYDRYGGAGFWLNINMTPDFPTAAEAMVTLYEAVREEPLDGVIVADPRMLAALLTLSGPAQLPGVGAVDADSVVDYVTNEAYAAITDPELRKRVLGGVAASALQGLLSGGQGGDDAADVVATLAQAAGAGHLQLYSVHAQEQDAFVRAGVAGALPDVAGDFLGVFVNNAAANKVDFYAERTVDYEVALSADGSAEAVARVELGNDAPTEGQPAYVIGPNVEGLAAGDNLSLVSVYAPRGAELDAFARRAGTGSAEAETELGRPVFTTRVHLASGARERLDFGWHVPDAWEARRAARGGHYEVTIAAQPTLRPTRLRLAVHVPAGTVITHASEGLRVSADAVVFDGPLAATTTFEVDFAVAGPDSWWERVRELLARPLW